jgi:hypothetical protein
MAELAAPIKSIVNPIVFMPSPPFEPKILRPPLSIWLFGDLGAPATHLKAGPTRHQPRLNQFLALQPARQP